nr:hypothetical protein [Candidatus Sigynarchaeota archaeon]
MRDGIDGTRGTGGAARAGCSARARFPGPRGDGTTGRDMHRVHRVVGRQASTAKVRVYIGLRDSNVME